HPVHTSRSGAASRLSVSSRNSPDAMPHFPRDGLACKRADHAKTERVGHREVGWRPCEKQDSKSHHETPLLSANVRASGKAPCWGRLTRCCETHGKANAEDATDPSPPPAPCS